MPKKDINILYVDDEVSNLTTFKASFRRNYSIYTAESAKKAQELLKEHDIQIIISDQKMPEMTGVEFFESIIDQYPDPIRILITGYTDIQSVINAINKGSVFKYFTKPWNEELLKENIHLAAELYFERKKQKELTQKLIEENRKIEFMLRQKLLS